MNVKVKADLEPTLISLELPPLDYSLSLLQMRDAGQYYHTNCFFEEHASHYLHIGGDSKRKLFLICFHREIGDSQDPEKSELLAEFEKLGFQPEGVFELLAVGKHLPGLQQLLGIIARKSDWRNPLKKIICACLGADMNGRFVGLDEIGDYRWGSDACFLVSRKPASK